MMQNIVPIETAASVSTMFQDTPTEASLLVVKALAERLWWCLRRGGTDEGLRIEMMIYCALPSTIHA